MPRRKQSHLFTAGDIVELAAAFDLLIHAPHIGRPYRQSPVLDMRRVLLKGTRYHV